MRVLRISLVAALTAACGATAYGQGTPARPAPAVEEVARPETPRSGEDVLQSDDVLQGSGIPTAPYPAGLSYMMSPQPFRVPYPNRIYYPIPHYVRHCPYYPKGFYWGADWNKHLLGCNPWLIHGSKRFNPYLTAAKIRHHAPGSAAARSSTGVGGSCPPSESEPLVGRPTTTEPADADEFTIPRPPVASRDKKAKKPGRARASLVLRESSSAELEESRLEKSHVAISQPIDEAESNEFAPPSEPSVKRPIQPKNRLVRQPLPAWQRAPAERR